MITVISGTFVVGELARPEPFRRFHHGPPSPPVEMHAREAADAYERYGSNGLAVYLERIESESRIKGFLFDDKLNELGHPHPPAEVAAARQTLSDKHGHLRGHGPLSSVASSTTTAAGNQYIFVAQLPPRRPALPFSREILHIFAIGLIGAAFCYWLARYLTSPVSKLREATQSFARGNLKVRVSPRMGTRRDELSSLAKDFDVMAEQIEALIESQRRLLGDISHELRSPLTRLNVALELARQRAGTEATSALERIQREAESLNEMIGQLLALTRLETGTVHDERTEVDLVNLVREISADAHYEARSRGRSVVLRTIETCTITGNQELLRRAINNVVRNAVYYTNEGTAVEIDLSTELDAFTNKSNVVIRIRDHGKGVPEESLNKIFEAFHRVDEARDRESGGTGLGLAIAQRAVKLHGGTIAATNAKDGGLIVTLLLPQ
ncbi:MAG TPA: ATP-binding protein [Pyrinomonadaceae bacterium]|nr:ATP-binding protein [Pyrinomonadaceae bacterium]